MASSRAEAALLAAPAPVESEKLAAEISSLDIQEEKDQKMAPHRSHDPQYNQKRSDPFQFGSRFLNQEDDVFEFNAWDHVETDDAYKEYAEQQFALQRQSPVSDFDKRKLRHFLHLLSGFLAETPASVMIYISIVHLNLL